MDSTKSRLIRLYVIEEQQIYRELYKSVLIPKAQVELLKVSSNGNIKATLNTISAFASC